MSDSRWMGLLFAAAFLARLVSCLGAAIFGTDSCHYLLMADWMREGRFHDALLIAYHPMYPLLIAATRSFCATTVQAGNVVAIVLGSAAILPLFATIRATLGRPAAVIAALLYAFQPAIVEVQSDVMTEGAFMFFLFGSMWLTWRMMEEPSLERGGALGAAAAAAFLTRPEGLLAVAFCLAWPLVELLRRRLEWWKRLSCLGVTFLVVALLLSPYLLWVRSERGHWGLSARPSAISAEKAVGIGDEGSGEGELGAKGRLVRIYLASLLRQTLFGLLIPFMILGLFQLRKVPGRSALFYASFPFAHLAGILFTLRTHNFMSERYLMPAMALLGGVTGLGMVAMIRWAAQRWPEARWRPTICAGALLLLVAFPAVRVLKVRRTECLGFEGAARWLLTLDPNPGALSGVEQISYYCGSRSYYHPGSREQMEHLVKDRNLRYVVYSDRDVERRPEYIAMLHAWDRLEPPLRYDGPPGTWKVYFQRVR